MKNISKPPISIKGMNLLALCLSVASASKPFVHDDCKEETHSLIDAVKKRKRGEIADLLANDP